MLAALHANRLPFQVQGPFGHPTLLTHSSLGVWHTKIREPKQPSVAAATQSNPGPHSLSDVQLAVVQRPTASPHSQICPLGHSLAVWQP